MQFITNLSKYLFLSVLSFCLVIVTMWNNDNIRPLPQVPLITKEVSMIPVIQQLEDVAMQRPDDSTVWSSMRREFKLDHKTQSARVQTEIHKLLADQNKLYSILKAAGPYIYFIQQQTKARGLPAELALIPVVESEFNPNDHSKKGASGLWQLMPETAHELGVKEKSGYDGRKDVIASTNAALAYFNDLGNMFKGDWYLAIAAYDCGQGKIESAERRTGSRSFWNLRLPRETQYYVPKLLAVAAIINNPQKYGVELPPVTNQPYFTTVKVQKPVSLVKVAKTSGISIQTLHRLNPDYNHGTVPAKKGADTLLVPVNKANTVSQQLSKAQVQPVPKVVHTVKTKQTPHHHISTKSRKRKRH